MQTCTLVLFITMDEVMLLFHLYLVHSLSSNFIGAESALAISATLKTMANLQELK